VNEPDEPPSGNTIRTEHPAPKDDDDLLEEIAEAYLARLQAGEAAERGPLIAAYPQFGERLERRLALVEKIYRLRPHAAEAVTLMPGYAQLGVTIDGVGNTNALDAQYGVEMLDTPPQVVGDYEIVSELGRGGMGVVYKAHHKRLNRPAALKMILAGGSARLEERVRFQVEAQSLASLQHPNIVQVFEVGDHQGRPYLALEFVEGGTLDQMILARVQNPIESAQVVETLARGMHAAHLRGIIHRDLKPANVLLQGPGKALTDFTPKITDFGLAKRLQEDTPTQTTGILGTPCYMAPEQAEVHGKPITPATDVYGLGAILYEMLTGRPPFKAETSLKTVRMVMLEEPSPPSVFHPRMPRDLETICLKCLQKDPSRRYGTAEQFAEDLRRFRVGEPIHARPVPRWERAWMWVRRRPTLAALVAVVILATIGFVVGNVTYNLMLQEERNRANHNLEQALDAVHKMLTVVGAETLEHEPGMEEKRKKLLLEALQFYQSFLRDEADNPRLKSELALAKKSMADVLRYLDNYSEAEAAYREALPLLAEAERNNPNDGRLGAARADGWNGLGETLRQRNQPRTAKEPYQESLKLWESRGNAEEQARVRYNLALALRAAGEPAAAEAELNKGIALLSALSGTSERQRQHLARCHINLGMLLMDRKAYGEAEANDERAVALLLDLEKANPRMPEYKHEHAVVLNNLGNLYVARAREEPSSPKGTESRRVLREKARKAHQDAIDLLTPLTVNFPLRLLYRQELANAYNGLGNVRASVGDLDGAEQVWSESCAILSKLVAENPGKIDYQGDLGLLWGNMGIQRALRQPATEDDWKKAWDFFRRAVTSLEETRRINAEHPDYKRALRNQYRNLAEASIRTQNADEAHQAALNLATVYPKESLDSYHAACFLARCIALAKNPDTSKTYSTLAIAHLRKALDNGFTDVDQWNRDEATIFVDLKNDADYQKLKK